MGFRTISKIAVAAGMVLALVGCLGSGGGGTSSAGTPSVGGSPSAPSGATLMIISVTPSFPASLPKGLTQQFTATGYYSNGTTQNITSSVAWSSTATTVATVSAAGLATGVGVGTTNITASAAGVSSTFVTLTVSPALLQSISISPVNPAIAAGLTQQFVATGAYSDGTTQNITNSTSVYWGSSNAAVATVNTPGVVLGVSPGTSTITASTASASGTPLSSSATLTVSKYSVSGTAALLPAGASIVLQNNGVDNLTIAANGLFTFNTPLASGTAYNVTVATQLAAPAHPCTVVDGSGTITTTYVTSIWVVCGMAVGTFAGTNGVTGSTNGTGTAATFWNPSGVAVDAAGNVYVADTFSHMIRKITPAGVVSTFAGSGVAGSANGTGTAATFNRPYGLAVDTAGNVYVADTSNNMIRKITPTGVVSTLAGNTVGGSANGTGTAASFWGPQGVAVDAAGNVYVADTSNNMIRKITAAGVVSTLAGSLNLGSANGTGTAASFWSPQGVAVDTLGNVYVADNANNMIRKIVIATGVVTTLAGTVTSGSADGIGTAASFLAPSGVGVDTAGNLYVADTGNCTIRKIVISTATVSTLAGAGRAQSFVSFSDGPALTATFAFPMSVAIDALGNWYVADSSTNLIRKITP